MWDDIIDLRDNPFLRDLAGLKAIWLHPQGLFDYYPLKHTVQWLQWQWWHNDTAGYHLTNIALHVLSALLVWRLLGKLGVRHGWLGGLIFAVHPLTVESVAWIAELKNTLSLPCLLLAFDAWIDFDAHGRKSDYAAALGLFAASLLCKSSGVMLPLMLLVHRWWRHHRVSARDVWATAPFFALSLAAGLTTIWFQHHAAIGDLEADFNPVGGAPARLACAGSSLVFYLGKIVLPVGLMPIYPQWIVNPPALWQLAVWPALATVAWWCWRRRDSWGRHAMFGGAWFVLFAAPILGFVTITSQRFAWVMDHLVYLPMLGIVGLSAAGLSAALDRFVPNRRAAVIALGLGLGGPLAWLSRGNSAMFASEETYWRSAVARNPAAWFAHYSLGNALQARGRPAEARACFAAALRLRPGFADAHYNLANLLREAGEIPAAIDEYREAVRFRPQMFMAHANLGVALAGLGRVDDAIAENERALAIEPKCAAAHYNLGSVLAGTGRFADAIPQFAAALAIDPDYPGAENNLAISLAAAHRPQDALANYARALELAPKSAETHNNLGSALLQLGRPADAIAQFRRALELRPDYVNAHANLAIGLFQTGHPLAAAEQLGQALKFAPDNVDLRLNYAAALNAAGRTDEAVREYDEARKRRPGLPPLQR